LGRIPLTGVARRSKPLPSALIMARLLLPGRAPPRRVEEREESEGYFEKPLPIFSGRLNSHQTVMQPPYGLQLGSGQAWQMGVCR
jgi:hypothetical protein